MRLIKDLMDYFYIKKSGKFDSKYYIFTYEDVRKNDIDPLWHFVRYGWKEGRKPNKDFDIKSYMKEYSLKNCNPFVHYLKNNCLNINEIEDCIDEDNDYEMNLDKFPLVSIIILTRNGLNYMQTLLEAIQKNTLYKNYELIIVDNASEDDTLKYLKQKQKELPIKIIENSFNETFSKANNEAVKLAKGELLLFLNNDTKPMKGWLCELVKEYLNNPKLGSAGSKLIYPGKKGFKNSCKLQHVGIRFRYEGDFYRPYNMGMGEDIDSYNKKEKRACLTAACLLVPKKVFEEVGGFDENYIYGYEDVDLGLKIFSKGYDNVYVPTSKLYHYEFGTQHKDKNKEIVKRRLNNIKYFKRKWHLYIKKHYWDDKINGRELFCSRMHVGFIVSNKGENVAEGDYFTALELAEEFKKLGWKVSFFSLKHNEWYTFKDDIDVLFVLLDKYDLNKIPLKNKKIITVAWARNWFDRWVKNPSFNKYDIVLASGKSACDFIRKASNKEAILYPLATNPDRFSIKERDDFFKCDYCFTGSYWNDKREIIEFLNPQKIKFKFHIYGKNWEKIKKFKNYHKGFVSYNEIPKVYSNTKLVIDDANRVTKPYGSVNSRVFDALGAGVLVITNGKLGSLEIFNGELPYYESQEELENLIEFYLTNEEERKKKVDFLKKIVLKEHTYKKRAEDFIKILEDKFIKKSIVIKIPTPNWKVVREWGDYHFAKSLKKEFEKLNYKVVLQVLSEWDREDEDFDNVLVLRGLSKYSLKPHHFNIMWNISHPDKIDIDEYNSYDLVFVASSLWANKLKDFLSVEVECLLQCTDDELFKKIDIQKDIDILFVGNSRKVFRKIIKDLLPCKYDVHIYGKDWENFIDNKYIKAVYIENSELYKYYNRAKIVLNDHWEDMREKGFISNRIFDASACGSFIISDNVMGLKEIFGDCIETYVNKDDLHKKIEFYLNNESEREKKAINAMNIVKNNHTFRHRVNRIHQVLMKRAYWWEK